MLNFLFFDLSREFSRRETDQSFDRKTHSLLFFTTRRVFLNSNKTPAYKKQSSCLCLLFIEYVWFMSVILQYDVGDAPAHWFSCQITCDNAASVPLTRQGTRLVSMAYIIVYDNSPRNFLALFAIKQYTENSFRINQQPNDSNGKKILNRKMFCELSVVKEIYLQPFNTVGNRRQV